MKILKQLLEEIQGADPEEYIPRPPSGCGDPGCPNCGGTTEVIATLTDDQKRIFVVIDGYARIQSDRAYSEPERMRATICVNTLISLLSYDLRDSHDLWDNDKISCEGDQFVRVVSPPASGSIPGFVVFSMGGNEDLSDEDPGHYSRRR